MSYHLEQFDMLCGWLHPYTTRCIFSFVDSYRGSPFGELEEEEKITAGGGACKDCGPSTGCPCTPARRSWIWRTCGIRHAACIDREKIREIVGYKLDLKRGQGTAEGVRLLRER